MVARAEELGYDCVLLAEHLINILGEDRDQLETWTSLAALAEATDKIELIGAIKPLLFHPVVFAKLALQVEEISRGRLSLNVVNGWFKPEIEAAGIEFPEHSDRYKYGSEWLEVVRRLMSGERLDFDGQFFAVHGYQLLPRDEFRSRPEIYLSGESPEAQALAARSADISSLNGWQIERVAAAIGDVGMIPRLGTPIRFALNAFPVTRPSDEEAFADLAYLGELVQRDDEAYQYLIGAVDDKAVMFQTIGELMTTLSIPSLGLPPGTAAGLIGSYGRVAERVLEFHRLGVETFVLQFQPFEDEMERFAAEVIPRVHRLAALAA